MNDEEGTNSRHRGREEFVPNRQADVKHDEESIKVDRSQSKLIFELKNIQSLETGFIY